MKTKFTKIIASLIAVFGLGTLALAPVALSTPTYAADEICSMDVPQSVKDAYGCEKKGSEADFSNALQGILNGIIGFLGVVAVIVIVIGGVMYMTSQGDPGKTKKAKDTILYATIGLIISVLAFAITNFVIINVIGGKSTNSSEETSTEK
ncbi:hypothetical protein IJJ37_01185 [Candidatus Saccharibacteria bacterium]|nr:hypothetical protein [Candidatus Saccharibacteria bacterium]